MQRQNQPQQKAVRHLSGRPFCHVPCLPATRLFPASTRLLPAMRALHIGRQTGNSPEYPRRQSSEQTWATLHPNRSSDGFTCFCFTTLKRFLHHVRLYRATFLSRNRRRNGLRQGRMEERCRQKQAGRRKSNDRSELKTASQSGHGKGGSRAHRDQYTRLTLSTHKVLPGEPM